MTLASVIIFFLLLTTLLGCVIYLVFARLQQLEDIITRPEKTKPLRHPDESAFNNTTKKAARYPVGKSENKK